MTLEMHVQRFAFCCCWCCFFPWPLLPFSCVSFSRDLHRHAFCSQNFLRSQQLWRTVRYFARIFIIPFSWSLNGPIVRSAYNNIFASALTFHSSSRGYCNSFRCRRFSSQNLLNDCVVGLFALNKNIKKKQQQQRRRSATSSKWHLKVSAIQKRRAISNFRLFKWAHIQAHARVLINQPATLARSKHLHSHTNTWNCIQANEKSLFPISF